jgi:hypothetical protein
MKKRYFLHGLLFAFVAFQFISCENEPLTGTFPDDETNTAEEGQFVAQIEGEEFVAVTATATMTANNYLVITGSKPGGENITLAVENAAVGNFNLNNDFTNHNFGAYFDGSNNNLLPFKSVDSIGGLGQMVITEIDTVNNTVTGTFSFKGVREKHDGDGNPILDDNGNPVMENIQISNGAFNSIVYTLDDGNGDGDGDGNGNPNDEFFAKVDGVDFVADSISVTEPVIGDIHMIKIKAKSSANGKMIRIDVPRNLGVGTFEMVNISDGTKLIALYNAGGGAENLTSNPGTITITEFDLEAGVLKATFAFTGTDPLGEDPTVVEVTEGGFTANFEGVPGANNVFRAKVDGTEFAPEEVIVTQSVVNQYPTITISGMVGDQKLELTFPATVTEDTYDMSMEVTVGDEIVGTYTPVAGSSISYVSSPGVLTITNYDLNAGIIEGTFNFTAVDATGQDPTIYQVTDGEFLAVLQ